MASQNASPRQVGAWSVLETSAGSKVQDWFIECELGENLLQITRSGADLDDSGRRRFYQINALPEGGFQTTVSVLIRQGPDGDRVRREIKPMNKRDYRHVRRTMEQMLQSRRNPLPIWAREQWARIYDYVDLQSRGQY